MRQLRRFAVEHRENELNWNDASQGKYYFYCNRGCVDIDYAVTTKHFGVVYFDTREAAEAALDTFYDELIWYFTEYKDSL